MKTKSIIEVVLVVLIGVVLFFPTSGYVGSTANYSGGAPSPRRQMVLQYPSEFSAAKAEPVSDIRDLSLGDKPVKVGVDPAGVVRIKLSKEHLSKQGIKVVGAGGGQILISISGIRAKESLLNLYGINVEDGGVSIISKTGESNTFTAEGATYLDVSGLTGYLLGVPFVQLP